MKVVTAVGVKADEDALSQVFGFMEARIAMAKA